MSYDLSLSWRCLLMQGCHLARCLLAQRASRREPATALAAIPSLRWRLLRRACPTASAQLQTGYPRADSRAARRITRSSRSLSLCMSSNSISCLTRCVATSTKLQQAKYTAFSQAALPGRQGPACTVSHRCAPPHSARQRHVCTAGTMPQAPSFLERYCSSGTISVDVVLLATSLQVSPLLCHAAMASRGCQGGSCVSWQNNFRWEGRTHLRPRGTAQKG